MVISHSRGGDLAYALQQHYPSEQQKIAQAMSHPHAFIAKSVGKGITHPASTTDSSWAGALSGIGGASVFASLAPQSIYSQLSARSVRIDTEGFGSIVLPRRATAASPYSVFVGEGQAIPVRATVLGATPLSTKKAAVISHYSNEISKRSVPVIETVLRTTLAEDLAIGVDAILVSAGAATAVQPAGILNGIAPLTASSETGSAAISADLAALISALGSPLDPVLIMSSAQQVALSQLPGTQPLPIFVTNILAAGTIIALDAADFVTATGDDVQIDVVSDAVVHQSDVPHAIVDDAGVVATPTVSLFQQNLIGVRVLEFLGWQLRSGKVSWMVVTW